MEDTEETISRLTRERDEARDDAVKAMKLASIAADKLKARAAREKVLVADVARLGRWLDRNITQEDAMCYALGLIAGGAADAPNAWEREVAIVTEDGAKRTARFSVAWADGESLHSLLAQARAAIRADLHCDECGAVATRSHHEPARKHGGDDYACDVHSVATEASDGHWTDLPHAAAVRAARVP